MSLHHLIVAVEIYPCGCKRCKENLLERSKSVLIVFRGQNRSLKLFLGAQRFYSVHGDAAAIVVFAPAEQMALQASDGG